MMTLLQILLETTKGHDNTFKNTFENM